MPVLTSRKNSMTLLLSIKGILSLLRVEVVEEVVEVYLEGKRVY